MERVELLEERVAHLMRAVEDLSDVVARQATEIAGLERRVRLLMERAAEEEALGDAPRRQTVRRRIGKGATRGAPDRPLSPEGRGPFVGRVDSCAEGVGCSPTCRSGALKRTRRDGDGGC